MEVNKTSKCLSKLKVSVRRKDSSFKKTSLLSVRAALDQNPKSPPHNEKFPFGTSLDLFSESNKRPNSDLKQLISDSNL